MRTIFSEDDEKRFKNLIGNIDDHMESINMLRMKYGYLSIKLTDIYHEMLKELWAGIESK